MTQREESGYISDPSAFHSHQDSGGYPRTFYRLTAIGMAASDYAWSNPFKALYGL